MFRKHLLSFRAQHALFHCPVPINQLRLVKNLDKSKNQLDVSYKAFAKLLTDFKMDAPDPKSEKFNKLLVRNARHIAMPLIYTLHACI